MHERVYGELVVALAESAPAVRLHPQAWEHDNPTPRRHLSPLDVSRNAPTLLVRSKGASRVASQVMTIGVIALDGLVLAES